MVAVGRFKYKRGLQTRMCAAEPCPQCGGEGAVRGTVAKYSRWQVLNWESAALNRLKTRHSATSTNGGGAAMQGVDWQAVAEACCAGVAHEISCKVARNRVAGWRDGSGTATTGSGFGKEEFVPLPPIHRQNGTKFIAVSPASGRKFLGASAAESLMPQSLAAGGKCAELCAGEARIAPISYHRPGWRGTQLRRSTHVHFH